MEDVVGPPAWNDQQAEKLIGARVLIGITWMPPGGPEHEQMFGVIKSANAIDGFEVALEGTRVGETYWLPPDPQNFSPGQPGDYRLRGAGEVVTDPDFISTWTIHPPAR
jgi:hypothetical protein